MEEIWKDIEGYEGLYQISTAGRVKSLKRVVATGKNFRSVKETILNHQIDHKGYPTVNLYKENGMKTKKVHRLKAIAFIPNPENLS